MEKETDQTLHLEDVLMKIATRLINIPIDEFHTRIDEAMSMMGRFLDVDRVYVFDYDFENELTSNTFEWCMDGVDPQIDYLQNVPISEIIDDWVAAHKKNQMVIHEDVMSLGPDNHIYQILEPQGVLSICTVPLYHKEECFGFVGFDDVRKKRQWKEHEFKLLRVFAEMMVNAIIKEKTDLKMIELKEKAQQANKAKGVFLAQMSHEIRTPLNGVYNAFYLLSQTLKSNDYKSYLEIAQTSLEGLSSIVNNILDLSKIEAGKMDVRPEKVDLEHEITKTIRTIRPTIRGKQLDCYFEYDYRLSKYVMIDMKKLNQIILNLINNAIKFTDYGYIKTSISYKHDEQEMIDIIIEDTGIGMNETDQKRVFESFYQASNNQHKGTGLGLPIIYELVQIMKGHIELQSELNKGSMFKVSLPISTTQRINYHAPRKSVLILGKDPFHTSRIQMMMASMDMDTHVGVPTDAKSFDIVLIDDETSKDTHIQSLLSSVSHPETVIVYITKNHQQSVHAHITLEFPISRAMIISRINQKINKLVTSIQDVEYFDGHVLIVDDNEINLEALKAILTMHGISVDLAISGAEAIEKIKLQSYDLILADIQMPLMDGYELSRKIKSMLLEKCPPIIAVTANVFLSAYDVKMVDLIDDVIYKPVQINQLFKVLRKYLRHQKHMVLPEHLSVISLDTFQMYFSESQAAGEKLIHHFLANYEHDYLEMIAFIQASEYQKAYQKIHYFKGPLSYMGADRLIYILSEFMVMMQQHHDISHNNIEILDIEIDKFLKALETWKK